ncbi:N-methylhydantoinase A [Sporobacter termitidis DSM 10068]|uniref:N-methylhydantoinase A n=1 Tax=Sporobacter termitidis DSM 10068 TaxID=1123282 RepID=A0A1M5XB05_9FIRM|nr:hydantoinase/oxoprolinase family protein [Sporobacter termitidis]SHH97045.1 N-methylhydantoinase A [Sporobacter termitidis DSM 10068]
MASEIQYRLGIDIGGTFTDFTLVDTENNTAVGVKTPTVPLHPEHGIRNGLELLIRDCGLKPEKLDYFVHGMTIGLNALLQRKGAKLALFVTEGFRDILTMQRMRLPVPYDFRSRLPEPLVPRSLVFGIPERIGADGAELVPLDIKALDMAAEEALRAGAEGIALCFLHSYENPDHERQAAERLAQKHPGLKLCRSSALWPEIREYERASIAVINLYIQKNVEAYFENLKQVLAEENVAVRPFITQSNGGIMNLDSAAAAPVRTLFSGPAAGVIGAIHEAGRAGEGNLLTFDMGGTSTDISVVLNGEPTYSQSGELAGFPIVIPSIDIESIGAGGGSIAWIDKGGLLKVGPESAGSDPGPACYGKSALPTLTDAFLLCGYLNAARFAAGRQPLDIGRAKSAVRPLAEVFGKEERVLADQMIQISVANMYAELSNIMERKGFDPRELSVVAYGGGGPVTANFVAEEIHAKDVFVPFRPGTLCAMGALSAAFVYDAVFPNRGGAASVAALRERFYKLREEAEKWLESQNAGVTDGMPAAVRYLADARYRGQSYEIQIQITEDMLSGADCSAIEEAFHKQHQSQYGHFERDAEVELVNLRARITARTPELPAMAVAPAETRRAAPGETREIFLKGKSYSAGIFSRESLKSGNLIAGPAIVEQDDTTVLILPGWHGVCDAFGNIRIVRDEEGNQ